MMDELPRRINSRFGNIIFISGITALSVFGLIFTSMLIGTNVSSAQLEGIAFVANQTTSHKIGGSPGSDEITIITRGLIYSWIFKYIFENKNVFSHIRDTRPITTSKILLVVDSTYKHVISKSEGENETQLQRLVNIFDETSVQTLFKDTSQDYDKSLYPYTGIQSAAIGSRTEQIRTNY